MTDPRGGTTGSHKRRREAAEHPNTNNASNSTSRPTAARQVPWETRFYQLQQFRNQWGHADPVWEADGPASVNQLACWLQHQRSFYRQRIHLTATQIQRLVRLGCTGFDPVMIPIQPHPRVVAAPLVVPLAPAPANLVRAPVPAPIAIAAAPTLSPVVPLVAASLSAVPLAPAPVVVTPQAQQQQPVIVPPAQQPQPELEQQGTKTNATSNSTTELDSSSLLKLEGTDEDNLGFGQLFAGEEEENGHNDDGWGNLLPVDVHNDEDDDILIDPTTASGSIMAELMGEDQTDGELKWSARCMELQALKDEYGQATPLEGSALGKWLKEQQALHAQEKLPGYRLKLLRDIGTHGFEEASEPTQQDHQKEEGDPELKTLLADHSSPMIDESSLLNLSLSSLNTATKPERTESTTSAILTSEPGIAICTSKSTTTKDGSTKLAPPDGMVTPATVSPSTADLTMTTPAPYAPIAPPIVTPSPAVASVSVTSSAPSVAFASSNDSEAAAPKKELPPPAALLPPKLSARPLPQPVAQLRPARGATRGSIINHKLAGPMSPPPAPAPAPKPDNAVSAATTPTRAPEEATTPPSTKPARRMSNSKSKKTTAGSKPTTKKTTTTKTKAKKKAAKDKDKNGGGETTDEDIDIEETSKPKKTQGRTHSLDRTLRAAQGLQGRARTHQRLQVQDRFRGRTKTLLLAQEPTLLFPQGHQAGRKPNPHAAGAGLLGLRRRHEKPRPSRYFGRARRGRRAAAQKETKGSTAEKEKARRRRRGRRVLSSSQAKGSPQGLQRGNRGHPTPAATRDTATVGHTTATKTDTTTHASSSNTTHASSSNGSHGKSSSIRNVALQILSSCRAWDTPPVPVLYKSSGGEPFSGLWNTAAKGGCGNAGSGLPKQRGKPYGRPMIQEEIKSAN